jgi:hypothetical protein
MNYARINHYFMVSVNGQYGADDGIARSSRPSIPIAAAEVWYDGPTV